MDSLNVGRIVQVIGPVGRRISAGKLLTILNAVRIVDDEKLPTVPIDIASRSRSTFGENRVRASR